MINTNIKKSFGKMQALFLSIIKLIQFFFAVNQYWALSHIKQGFLPFYVFTNLLRMRLIHEVSGSFFSQFLSIVDKRDQNHSGAVTFQHLDLSLDLSGFKNLTGLCRIPFYYELGITVS